MRDFADQLERRLILAAQAQAQERRGPARRLAMAVFALPRPWLVAPVAVAVAAVVALALDKATTPTKPAPVVHASPVSFRYPERGPDSGDIIATVTDPFAAQSSLNAAFQAAGLNIVVTLEPASPSLVGTLLGMGGPSSGPQIQPLDGGGTCVTGSGGTCPIGVKIPHNFTGSGEIELGRPAKAYVSTTSAFAPGESLHCSGLLNQQVSHALPTIQADNITAYWGDNPFPLSPNSGPGTDTQSPPTGTEYITEANPVAAGAVWFDTSSTPVSAEDLQREHQTYDLGC
jgi:hypothetical protein